MAKKIAISNQKGGVGKTTTAVNLADALRHIGYKVLFIDLDPQCNSTGTYDAKVDGVNTIVDVLKKDCTALEAVQHTMMGDIIAGDTLLAQEETHFNNAMAREKLLKNRLKDVDEIYDFIVIDTPPNLGIYMFNALTAADGCIIPIQAEQYAVDGLGLLLGTIDEIRESVNSDLKIYGVLLTAFDGRNSLDNNIRKILPEVGQQKGFNAFNTVIRTCQDIKTCQAIEAGNNRSLFDNCPKSNAAIDYVNLTKELLELF